jgi:alpha-1,6-mannosyltransferase
MHRALRDLRRGALPPTDRPAATQAILDTTEWFAPGSGGIRTYLLEKQRYLSARSTLRHVLVVPGAADAVVDAGPGARWYEFAGPRIPHNAPYRLLTSVSRMRRVLVHERPNVIEIGSPFLSPWVLFRAARGLDIPVVNFFHSHFPRLLGGSARPQSAWRLRLERAAWWYARRMDGRCVATIAASRFVQDDLLAAGVRNVHRIPLGVDTAHFTTHRRANAGEVRATLGLPADGPLVTFVGRLATEKDVAVLVDAWPAIERATDAHLVIAGEGPEAEALRARSRGTRVHWVPFLTDRSVLADLHAASAIYVSTSPHETFGLSPLEAMACGTPVLAADAGAAREHVLASGAGALFAPGDAGALAEQALALLASDLSALGDRARHFAETEHDWAAIFDRLVAVYASVTR